MTTLPPAEIDYEVECALDADVVGAFDAWLPGHVRQVLEAPGFRAADVLRPAEPAPDGKARRVVRYRVANRAALDQYLEQRAPALRADGAARFGGRVGYQRRVHAVGERLAPAVAAHELCPNCEAMLTGPYCASCGQHGHESARSIGTLFHDAWHVITHVDGRFWITLRRLLLEPGFLTNEYFAERRARYVPPFRLYLVLSVVFFGLTSLVGAFSPDESAAADATPAATAPADPAAAAASGPATAAAPAAKPAAGATDGETDGDGDSFRLTAKDCDSVDSGIKWLEGPLRRACHNAAAKDGRALSHAIVANVPKMMFVFLPLMAAAMLLLYWFPRRYYVEHLVYFLHTHAALFLGLIIVSLYGVVARLWPAVALPTPVAGTVWFFYALWYVYRSMRVHYRNGRWLTLAKLSVISLFYLIFISITLALTAVLSALTA